MVFWHLCEVGTVNWDRGADRPVGEDRLSYIALVKSAVTYCTLYWSVIVRCIGQLLCVALVSHRTSHWTVIVRCAGQLCLALFCDLYVEYAALYVSGQTRCVMGVVKEKNLDFVRDGLLKRHCVWVKCA